MMDTNLWLNNVAGYSLQVAVLVAVGSLLPILLCFRRPRIMLAYWQVLLATCLLLPAIQTWQARPAGQAAQAGRAETEFVLTGAGYEIDSLLLATFGVGVLVRLSWLTIGFARLRSYRRKARQISPLPALIEKLQSLTGGRARICLSTKIHSPVTFGVSRPVILLPAGFLEMEEKHQEAIACHELLHVRRSDWLFTLLEEAIRSFFWFHPAIWWVLGRIQLAHESKLSIVKSSRLLDERLGLGELIDEHLSDSRQGTNKQFTLADLLRQSVYTVRRRASPISRRWLRRQAPDCTRKRPRSYPTLLSKATPNAARQTHHQRGAYVQATS